LKFRQNFAEIRRKISFSLVTGKKNSVFFGFEIKKNRIKFTEISERNFVTADHRDSKKNEIVNPAEDTMTKTWS